MFQPELRRVLEKVGRTSLVGFNFFSSSDSDDNTEHWKKAIDAICDSAASLSSTKTGALIICERKTKLGEQDFFNKKRTFFQSASISALFRKIKSS